jgi:DNA replication protein DnaC
MKRKKNFLLYLGSPGIGKTHLCAAMFEWALRNFSSFRYFKEKDLQEHLRKIMIENGWDAHRELERLFDSDLIFLDDIGKLGHTDHKENMLFDAIDIRYNSTKPTVITSNLTIAEFRKIYEPRLCSRLFSNENIIIEAADAADYREIEE